MDLSQLTLALREKIEPRLIYSPFLRLIVFSPLFLLGFLAVVLTLIAGALYLPKIWRVSPDGFEPIVRISGLDMTQNWSLKRNARKLEEAGKLPEAVEAWQGAVAQNPADLGSLHGAIESAIKLPKREDRLFYSTITQIQWLLRINKTNSTDVELVSRACDHLGLYDYAAYLFGSLDKQTLPPAAQAVLIKNLFQQNRIPEFEAEMDRVKLSDPELHYYRLAHDAGWKNDPRSGEAFAELEKAAQEGPTSERVGHLLLRAAAQKNRVELYSSELDRLARRNEARADDHAIYWTLLAATGKTNEAVRLAESATVKPDSAMEIVRVTHSYLALGMIDQARELLKEMTPRYARSPELWMLYVNVLQAKKDWDGMREAARVIRQDVGSRETLWGYSYYLDGRADLEQKRDAAARIAFDQAATSTYEYGPLAVFVARELTRLGFADRAVQLFKSLETTLSENLGFWDACYAAAAATQDAAALLKATENSHRLFPKDISRLNNYAAALLINQTRPEEAIQLTLQLYTKFPESNAALINHSCSLLLNHRGAEARALLEKVNIRSLGAAELSQYYLTLFETYHDLKMWDQAERTRGLITETALFPIQRERLREKIKQMPSLAKAA